MPRAASIVPDVAIDGLVASDLKRLAALKDSDVVIDNDAPAWTPEMFARAV